MIQLPSEPKPSKVWIAIPTSTGHVTAGTFKSLIHDLAHMIVNGTTVVPFFDVGASDIYVVRAHIVQQFLNDTDATDLIMVDSDVAWDSFGIQRLLSHDVDVVGGAYPKRQEPLSFMYRSEITLNEAGKAQKALFGDAETGLCEVWGVPGGFVRIRRHVLEKMAAHYGPELTTVDPLAGQGQNLVRLFDPLWKTNEDGTRSALSEDYAFCQRWRDMGGKIYLDVNIPMGHTGSKMYHGCLGQWVNTEAPKEEKAA